MNKAYDRLEWGFLEKVLKRLGFAEEWIRMVMQCITTVRYSFLINGKAKGYIAPTRGIRQGDPLSPFLFLLGTEAFSALLEDRANSGFLKGITVCEGTPTIHHLLFADDSLLFGSASIEECTNIRNVLLDYERASGQKVNFEKGSIAFSKGVSPDQKIALADILGVDIVEKHEKYLGLPMYLGKKRTETFSFIKEKLKKKIEGWQGKLLSSAGKELLIRVVAQALPSYAMSCFLLPKEFCDSLHQLCAKFWWGSSPKKKKIHWLSWDRLCIPKEEGGMGSKIYMLIIWLC